VLKNIHYKMVDAFFPRLHDGPASPIGSAAKAVVTTGSTSRRAVPDLYCPQGRLMKLTWRDRPNGREALA